MIELKEVLEQIEETRGRLENIIREKDNLVDAEIIRVSQKLDSVLNRYNEILGKESLIM